MSAFDISPQAADNTSRILAESVLDRCSVGVMPAEALAYDADSFDMAVGSASIHTSISRRR